MDQTTISQGAILPLLISERDVVVVGEWLNWSHFDARSPAVDDFDVTSVAVPVGWFRQASADWQIAAFAMPLGQVLAAGVGLDLGDHGRCVRPAHSQRPSLVGAWPVRRRRPRRRPLSAVPRGILVDQRSLDVERRVALAGGAVGPTGDLLFRLGASPSGTSWQLDTADQEISVDLSTYDLGLSAERRIWRNVWANVELGVGGFRALTLRDSNWQGPGGRADPAPYLSLSLNFRPSLPADN